MARFFFDTSALIKLYHQEKGTEVVDRLLSQEQPVIVISDLTLIEMVSAFAKKVRTREITQETFETAVAAFEKDIPAFELLPINQDVGFSAAQLLKTRGVEQGLRTLDALQLASALVANKKQTLDLFVAADKTLLTVAEQESLLVLLV